MLSHLFGIFTAAFLTGSGSSQASFVNVLLSLLNIIRGNVISKSAFRFVGLRLRLEVLLVLDFDGKRMRASTKGY